MSFQVISLEGWTDIMYYVQDAHSFWDWIYFVLLIVVCIPRSPFSAYSCHWRFLNSVLVSFTCTIFIIRTSIEQKTSLNYFHIIHIQFILHSIDMGSVVTKLEFSNCAVWQWLPKALVECRRMLKDSRCVVIWWLWT